MVTLEHAVGKHVFTLHISDSLEKCMEEHIKTDYSKVDVDDLELYNMVDMTNSSGASLSDEAVVEVHKEFLNACAFYIAEFKPEVVIEELPKKKNGTFAKGRIQYPVLEAMGYESEDEYGYRRNALRWKVISDTEAELSIVSYVEKW